MFGFKKKQPESVVDEILGKIIYTDSQWIGASEFKLFEISYSIDIEMYSENKEAVTNQQKETYKKIINNTEIVEYIENVLSTHFPTSDFRCVQYRPLSLCIKTNGDCALIVSVGEKEDQFFQQNVAISIFPEIKYYGSDESYMSEVFFGQ